MNKAILDTSDYSFDASAKTITFVKTQIYEHLLLVTNLTDNKIIYNFGCEGFGGSYSGLILTLDYDTSSMLNSDSIQIIKYVEESSTEVSIIQSLELQSETLYCLQNILEEIQLNNKLIKEILR